MLVDSTKFMDLFQYNLATQGHHNTSGWLLNIIPSMRFEEKPKHYVARVTGVKIDVALMNEE